MLAKMTRHSLTTVIVINWNGRAHLERGLPPLLAQRDVPFEVMLVDNGSTDGSVELVRAQFPQVRLIALERNFGFVVANNIGMAQSEAEYVVALNNDTVPESDWLAALVDAAASDPRAAAVSSKMLFYGRPDLLDSAGIAADIAGHAWDAGAGTPDPGRDERAPREVFAACAGAALYRRAALVEASAAQGPGRGPFDEDFFNHAEDVDLCWRLRWLGYRCLYAPAARVLHVRSAADPESSPKKTFVQGRNKLWVVFKNYPAGVLALWLPVIWLYDTLAVARQLAVLRDPTPLRARLAAWQGWRLMRAKHAHIERAARVPFDAVTRTLDPLVSPWAMRRRFADHRQAYRTGGAGIK
jgi:GT2 family glycosyltransferase